MSLLMREFPTRLRFHSSAGSFVFGLCIAGLLAVAACPSSLSAQTLTLGGNVADARTLLPVAGASVTLLDAGGGFVDSALCDAAGNWSVQYAVAGVASSSAIPLSCSLEQNFPNPFNPSTRFSFTVAQSAPVRISVYNILGQVLDARSLQLSPGRYATEWKALGSAGVLFYCIESGGARLVRRMVQLDGHGHGGIGPVEKLSSDIPTARVIAAAESLTVVTRSLIYENHTDRLPLLDGARVNQRLVTIHDAATMIDLHNDVLEQIAASGFTYQIGPRHSFYHTDIPRLRDGGVDVQLFSVWINGTTTPAYATSVRYLDSLKAQFDRNANDIGFVTSADAAAAMNAKGKIAGVVLVEGGHMIEEDLGKLIDFYNRGMRVMTITWNNSSSWAISAADTRSATVGLSEFGKQVIRTLDSLGVLIDVSHVGIKTVEDILATTTHPILATHSGAYALRAHYRNLTDSQITAIAANGGVIGVVFYPPFLSSSTSTIATVIQHIDYLKNLAGIDHIALGSDFDGFSGTPVTGLENVSKFPALTEALLRHGYTRDDVRKILGENFLRVFRAVCH